MTHDEQAGGPTLGADDARRLALALPDTVEAAHFGKADFRVGGRIFASLPGPDRMVLRLTPEQQAVLTGAEPRHFAPVDNAWGRKGWTLVDLRACPEAGLRHALLLAWRSVAGRRRIATLGGNMDPP